MQTETHLDLTDDKYNPLLPELYFGVRVDFCVDLVASGKLFFSKYKLWQITA